MREFSAAYDPKKKRFVFQYKSKFLQKYPAKFDSRLEDLGDEVIIQKFSQDLSFCEISVPLEVSSDNIHHQVNDEGEKTGLIKIGIDPESAEELKEYSEQIQKRIFEFEKEIVMEETSGIEFIPLEGYPIEELQTDIMEALEKKRDFCVIDTMDSYLDFMNTLSLNQAYYKYDSDMYYNIFLAIRSGNMDELRELTQKSLKRKDWA